MAIKKINTEAVNDYPPIRFKIRLKRFLQNLAWGRESQVRTFTTNFTVLAFKMWTYGPKNREKWKFWV